MIVYSVIVALGLLLNLGQCTGIVRYFTFEAEDATTTNGPVGARMHRSAASNKLTFLLYEGSFIQHDFSIRATCIVNVDDVAYSNDGSKDQINITLASTMVGSFTTVAERGNGHLWNEIRNTGPIGTSVSIPPGSYKLRLKVVHADMYGMEIDKTTLRFNCDEDPKITTTGSTGSMTTGEIVGIVCGVVGVLGVLIAIPGCILAIKKMRQCGYEGQK